MLLPFAPIKEIQMCHESNSTLRDNKVESKFFKKNAGKLKHYIDMYCIHSSCDWANSAQQQFTEELQLFSLKRFSISIVFAQDISSPFTGTPTTQ